MGAVFRGYYGVLGGCQNVTRMFLVTKSLLGYFSYFAGC